MANEFSKEERVAFENLVAAFEDNLVLSRNVSRFETNSTEMERSADTIWRPVPYIATSYDGTDTTANFNDATQMSVPSSLSVKKNSPFILSSTDLRDEQQVDRLSKAAAQKLSSDINVSIMDTAANQGTLVVKRTSAASGFDDVAECEAIMNEQGVMMNDRYLALSTRDYNGMASNLAERQTLTPKALTAYERAFVGRLASFDTYKLDYANSLAVATATGVTIDGASQFYVPQATSTAPTGETSNVDNRYQDLDVTVGGGTIAVGDAFTIAGVDAVHHITKNSTGQPKTFRVIAIVSGGGGTGTIQISPPIISNEGGSDAETRYQNVTATPADVAAVTLLNTATASVNPFWYYDAIEILPGNYATPLDAGAQVLRSSTEQGFGLEMTKQHDINTKNTKYRLDVFYGTVMLNPEMCGIMIFNQV